MQFKRGTVDHGFDNSVSTRRQAGAEYLLPDRGAQLHACPITYPVQKVPLVADGTGALSGGDEGIRKIHLNTGSTRKSSEKIFEMSLEKRT